MVTQARRNKMAEQVEAVAAHAAGLVKELEASLKIGFVAIAGQIEARQRKTEAKADAFSLARFKPNPAAMKPVFEAVAVRELERAASAYEHGGPNAQDDVRRYMMYFAAAMSKARSFGPISNRTVASIRNVAERHMKTVSLVRIAVDAAPGDVMTATRLLLEAGLSPDFAGTAGELSPLVVAVQRQDQELMRLLVSSGANPYVRTAEIFVGENASRKPGNVDLIMNAFAAKRMLEQAPRPRLAVTA